MAWAAYHNAAGGSADARVLAHQRAGLALPRSFRYLRGVPGRRRLDLLACVALACVTAAAVGCKHPAKTPDEAYRRFSAAVEAHDGAALFDALDQRTRWSWMTIQKSHREAYDIVLSNYPEGPERDREARRFEPGATATSARELFNAQVAPAVLPELAPFAAADAHVETGPEDGHAAAVLASGVRVPLARGDDGSWGFAGLAKDAADQETRSTHDLDVVRASAADYERAATRAGK